MLTKYGPRPGLSSVTARAKFTEQPPSLVAGVLWTQLGARLSPNWHAVVARREVRAQDQLALETPCLETVVWG